MELVKHNEHLKNLSAAISSLGGETKPILKFIKGEYFVGVDNEIVAIDSLFAVDMINMQWGWLCWQDGRPVDRRLVAMATGQVPVCRASLGHDDQELWGCDDRGHPVDPWRRTIEVQMREMGGRCAK